MASIKYSPCYKCEERHAACHTDCEKYKQYKDELIINDGKIHKYQNERKYIRQNNGAYFSKGSTRYNSYWRYRGKGR